MSSSCTRGHGRLRSAPGSADRGLRSEQEGCPANRALHIGIRTDTERMGEGPRGAQGRRQGQRAQEMAIVRTWDFIPNTIELVAGFKEKENRNSCKASPFLLCSCRRRWVGVGQGAQSLAGTLDMWRS